EINLLKNKYLQYKSNVKKIFHWKHLIFGKTIAFSIVSTFLPASGSAGGLQRVHLHPALIFFQHYVNIIFCLQRKGRGGEKIYLYYF
ncbi:MULTISPECIES: hypothetical protein, partial [unclassified Providencia]